MATKEESLSLHIDIRWVIGESRYFVGEEDGRRVQMLTDAVSNHASDLLNFFFPHNFLASRILPDEIQNQQDLSKDRNKTKQKIGIIGKFCSSAFSSQKCLRERGGTRQEPRRESVNMYTSPSITYGL